MAWARLPVRPQTQSTPAAPLFVPWWEGPDGRLRRESVAYSARALEEQIRLRGQPWSVDRVTASEAGAQHLAIKM